MNLFRSEALAHVGHEEPARVLLYGPPGWRSYVAGAIAIVAVAALALTQIDLPRRVSAHGWVSPSRGLVSLRPAAPGYVAAVHVEVGDAVVLGQPLFELTLDPAPSHGATGAYYGGIQAEQTALKARQEHTRIAIDLTNNRFRARRSALKRSAGSAQRRRALQAQRVLLAEQRLHAMTVGASAIAPLELQHAQAQLLDERREFEGLGEEEVRIAEELGVLPNQERAELNALQGTLQALEQERLALERVQAQFAVSRTQTFVAPVHGRLTELRPRVGDQLRGNTTQATILPDDSQLQAELYLPSSALGYAAPGQPVRLKLEPFPYQKFGTVGATIRRVSTVLEDRSAFGSAPPPGPVFRAVAELERTHVQLDGQSFALQPQMQLIADIELESRKAWEWLLEPLLSFLHR